jgi:hypothetical protein
MSVLVVTVPGMEDLVKLAASVTAFAAREHLAVVPAVPQHDYGPEVCLGPEELDLPGFLDLAGKLGGGVLYLRAAPFDPASDEDQPDSPPERLVKCKGQTGQVSVAFAANGVVHFWEQSAAWYLEWQQLADRAPQRHVGMDEDDEEWRREAEERARLETELADKMLADPEFRDASRDGRQLAARKVIPRGTGDGVFWGAFRQAVERAGQMTEERYGQLQDRMEDLAAELLASPAYQQASSPGVRKKVAERFLIPHADGFFPPPRFREELYARAQRLAKARRASGGGLF